MKSILISIKPKWVAKILNGEKTIEVRKKFPKDYKGWVYIYCTKGKPFLYRMHSLGGDWFLDTDSYSGKVYDHLLCNGKVVARFYCDKVEEIDDWFHLVKDRFAKTCLTIKELIDYLNGKDGYAIYISQLEIFYNPIELWELDTIQKVLIDVIGGEPSLQNKRLTKAPQSYMFIEVEE